MPSIIDKEIVDMFQELNIDCKTGQPLEYYKKLSDGLDIPQNRADLDEKIWDSLYNVYSEYPSPEKIMQRIVNTVGDKRFKNDTLRVRILKQFIFYAGSLKGTKYYTHEFSKSAIDLIDDSVFEAPQAEFSDIDELNCFLAYFANHVTLDKEEKIRIREIILDSNCTNIFEALDSENELKKQMKYYGISGISVNDNSKEQLKEKNICRT